MGKNNSIVKYQPNEVIYMTGDDIDKLLLLKSGTVTMYASYAQYPVTENCIIG